jgi:spore coat protein U-like protein
MRRFLSLAFSVALAAFGVDPALGASATANLAVGVAVTAECVIQQTPVVDFGTLASPFNVDIVTTIGVQCTAGSPYSIALDAGKGVGAAAWLRVLTGPRGARTGYSLYKNASRTQVWGDASDALVTGTGTGSPFSHTIYARLFAGGEMRNPGVYTDTVRITLSF